MLNSATTLKSFAKINLYIEVTSKRDDGYHEILTLFSPINIFDTVTVTKTDAGIRLTCSDESVPLDGGNLAHRAAELFFKESGMAGGADIDIEKRIPVAAGLGGGSSNAAAVLSALNGLFGSPFGTDKLLKMSSALGADVPFFIEKRPVLAKGVGDVFVSYPKLPELHIVLVNPGFHVSTKWAYSNVTVKDAPDSEALIGRLDSLTGVREVASILKNSLEEPVIKEYPLIADIKGKLMSEGALGALMSGSGPTVFGLFETKGAAEDAVKNLKLSLEGCKIFLTTNRIEEA